MNRGFDQEPRTANQPQVEQLFASGHFDLRDHRIKVTSPFATSSCDLRRIHHFFHSYFNSNSSTKMCHRTVLNFWIPCIFMTLFGVFPIKQSSLTELQSTVAWRPRDHSGQPSAVPYVQSWRWEGCENQKLGDFRSCLLWEKLWGNYDFTWLEFMEFMEFMNLLLFFYFGNLHAHQFRNLKKNNFAVKQV